MTSPEMMAEGMYCAGCGYDLRASTGERCPECGLTATEARLQLPWERRAEVGRVSAFARTTWLATIHPSRLARSVGGTVDAASANWFRRWVLLAAGCILCSLFVGIVHQLGGPERLSLVPEPTCPTGVSPSLNAATLCWSVGATQWPVLPIGLCIALVVGTRWDHWFALRHMPPRSRSSARLGARYTVAPLLPFAALIAVGAGMVWLNTLDDWFALWTLRWLNWIAGSLAAAIVLLTWTCPARYALHVPEGGIGRAIVVLVGTSVQWLVALAISLVVLPAVVGFAWVVIDSVR